MKKDKLLDLVADHARGARVAHVLVGPSRMDLEVMQRLRDLGLLANADVFPKLVQVSLPDAPEVSTFSMGTSLATLPDSQELVPTSTVVAARGFLDLQATRLGLRVVPGCSGATTRPCPAPSTGPPSKRSPSKRLR